MIEVGVEPRHRWWGDPCIGDSEIGKPRALIDHFSRILAESGRGVVEDSVFGTRRQCGQAVEQRERPIVEARLRPQEVQPGREILGTGEPGGPAVTEPGRAPQRGVGVSADPQLRMR